MGNAITPCCFAGSSSSVKLIFWEGTTKVISGKCLAGEILFQLPDRIICHAESFYIGHRIPALSIDDELVRGQTYFVLPVDRFSGDILSSKSLVSLASNPKGGPIKFGNNPFEYVKGANGKVLVRVSPEFIMKIISSINEEEEEESSCRLSNSPLCSTPELQKHYAMLVGSKEQLWSPKLETISECKGRMSPYRLLGLDWRSEKINESN